MIGLSRNDLLRTRGWGACILTVVLLQICANLQVSAQVNASSGMSAAQPAASDGAPSEAARRQALSPFRFILRNAEPQQKKEKPKQLLPEEAKAPAPRTTGVIAPPHATPSPSEPSAAARPEQLPISSDIGRANDQVRQATFIPSSPKPLIPIRQDPPLLTTSVLRDIASGNVTVSFDIRPDGATGEIKVVKSSNRRLNVPVTSAVSMWRFQPIEETRSVEVDFVFNEQ